VPIEDGAIANESPHGLIHSFFFNEVSAKHDNRKKYETAPDPPIPTINTASNKKNENWD
jgi:hypothetical protein